MALFVFAAYLVLFYLMFLAVAVWFPKAGEDDRPVPFLAGALGPVRMWRSIAGASRFASLAFVSASLVVIIIIYMMIAVVNQAASG